MEQVVNDLKKNELMFNEKIKDEINKDMIKKYDSVMLTFYERNKSEINEIISKAAKIKNENEVATILQQLKKQDKNKAEEERKKKEEQKQQNNGSKTEKNNNKKEKNSNEKTNKKNNQANIAIQNKADSGKNDNKNLESNLKSSSKQEDKKNENENKNPEINLNQQKDIEEEEKQKNQRIVEAAESGYFHEMLWSDFYDYYKSDKKHSLEQVNVYHEFRILSMSFANSIKMKYAVNDNLMVTGSFQTEEIDTFLVKYLLDDNFNQFEFQPRPRKYKNDTNYDVQNTTDSAIVYYAQGRAENIATNSRPLIFNRPDYQEIAGAIDGPAENNDCFILSLLSHLSFQEVEEIKKFVDKNKIRKLYIKNDKEEIEEQTWDLFDKAGGNDWFISDKAKIIAYIRAALAIKILEKWNKFPHGNNDRKLGIKDWDEFETLLGNGPFRNDDNKITGYGQRQISGESHIIAQTVADLTKRPYLLLYKNNLGQIGYFLAITDAVSMSEVKKYNGLDIGDFKFDDVYSRCLQEQEMKNVLQSECISKENKLLTEVNEKLLKLIDDGNVIGLELSSGENMKNQGGGHFWAIGRNYMGKTLTTQKNWDVFNKFNVERDLKSDSALRRNLDQFGFTEENKNMLSCYFLANEKNTNKLKDITDFLQTLDSNNIKANFDKWFKNLICTDDGKIDEDNFANPIIKLFYSPNKDQKLCLDDDKRFDWLKVINNFSSCVPSQFHSKWFKIVYNPFTHPIDFYKVTVIEKLEKIKLGDDKGMKYFGYFIGKFVEFVESQEKVTQKAYNKWRVKFIDSDNLENILTCKNDIENDFLSEVKTGKFTGHDSQDIVNNLSKFIRLFDPSDLYVLIDVIEKKKNVMR